MCNIIRSVAITVKDGITTAATTGRATGTARVTGRTTDLIIGLIISPSSAITVLHPRGITVRHRSTAQAATVISTGAITATALTAHRTIHFSRITVRVASAIRLIPEA